MLWSPCFCRGSAELSDSSLERRLVSTLLLVSGLKSVIVPQSFNQENVRQEKARQVKKRSKTIQTTVKRRESLQLQPTDFSPNAASGAKVLGLLYWRDSEQRNGALL